MTKYTILHASVDEDLKNEAAEILAAMGLTVSDLVRMTLSRVVQNKALPFELDMPNAKTRAAIKESDAMMKADKARFG